MPKKYYAVASGRKTGIFSDWYGEDGAEAQVKGFAGAVFKGFPSLKDAEAWLQHRESESSKLSAQNHEGVPAANIREGTVVIYTDGGCIDNPGPGGYGVVILEGQRRTELSGGVRWTTNNRMELMAVIVALEQVTASSPIALYSDSKYVVDGLSRGWARQWRQNGWKKKNGSQALNSDLWARLLDLLGQREINFHWVKGHAGHPENERCDALATRAATGPGLAVDRGYENVAGPRAGNSS